jgi:hypothetical protein
MFILNEYQSLNSDIKKEYSLRFPTISRFLVGEWTIEFLKAFKKKKLSFRLRRPDMEAACSCETSERHYRYDCYLTSARTSTASYTTN